MTAAQVLPHRDAVLTLLRTEARIGWYLAEVPATPPLDPDGRVHAYAVFWPEAGDPAFTKVCGRSVDLDWSFTVALYAGDEERWVLARDWLCAALVDTTLTVPGRVCDRLTLTYGPKRPLRYDNPLPPRLGGPLMFRLRSTPA